MFYKDTAQKEVILGCGLFYCLQQQNVLHVDLVTYGFALCVLK